VVPACFDEESFAAASGLRGVLPPRSAGKNSSLDWRSQSFISALLFWWSQLCYGFLRFRRTTTGELTDVIDKHSNHGTT